MLNKTPKK